METSDFRRGNIVEWNKKPFIICRIFEDCVENELWCKPINEIHPIPLTEEILLKCGFDKQILFEDECCFFCNGDLSLSCEDWNKDKFYYNTEIEIKYVHQLQNLCFALTLEELKTCINIEIL